MNSKRLYDATIQRFIRDNAPDFEGIAIHNMECVDWLSTKDDCWAYFAHEELGDKPVALRLEFNTDGSPRTCWWDYDGVNCTVNGVVYPSRREAIAVRDALREAGLGECYAGHPDAIRVLRKRLPQFVERSNVD